MKSLSLLLEEAAGLFPKSGGGGATFDFFLGKFPGGWRFDVINDWHRWMDKKLETHFGLYQTPELAVIAFLSYVREKKVRVRSLAHK